MEGDKGIHVMCMLEPPSKDHIPNINTYSEKRKPYRLVCKHFVPNVD